MAKLCFSGQEPLYAYDVPKVNVISVGFFWSYNKNVTSVFVTISTTESELSNTAICWQKLFITTFQDRMVRLPLRYSATLWLIMGPQNLIRIIQTMSKIDISHQAANCIMTGL